MKELIEALEHSIECKNWYSALAIGLTLPDICGYIEGAGEVKSKDRCIKWFDEYMADHYLDIYPSSGKRFLTGNDFYALRCSYLHQGETNIEGQPAREIISNFKLVDCKLNIVHKNMIGTIEKPVLQLQIDIFCKQIKNGAERWLVKNKDNFSGEIKSLIKIEKEENGVISI